MKITGIRLGKAVVIGILALASASAIAQAPPPGGGGGGFRGGFGGPVDRASTIQRFNLADAALKLTDAQKAEIDKVADAYVKEITEVNAKYPMAQGSPPSPDAQAARQKARDTLTAAVSKVLNAEQRTTWEAAQAASRGGRGGGFGGPGGGGPGGGPGGPPRGN